jgi:hypothetical protein
MKDPILSPFSGAEVADVPHIILHRLIEIPCSVPMDGAQLRGNFNRGNFMRRVTTCSFTADHNTLLTKLGSVDMS